LVAPRCHVDLRSHVLVPVALPLHTRLHVYTRVTFVAHTFTFTGYYGCYRLHLPTRLGSRTTLRSRLRYVVGCYVYVYVGILQLFTTRLVTVHVWLFYTLRFPGLRWLRFTLLPYITRTPVTTRLHTVVPVGYTTRSAVTTLRYVLVGYGWFTHAPHAHTVTVAGYTRFVPDYTVTTGCRGYTAFWIRLLRYIAVRYTF